MLFPKHRRYERRFKKRLYPNFIATTISSGFRSLSAGLIGFLSASLAGSLFASLAGSWSAGFTGLSKPAAAVDSSGIAGLTAASTHSENLIRDYIDFS